MYIYKVLLQLGLPNYYWCGYLDFELQAIFHIIESHVSRLATFTREIEP